MSIAKVIPRHRDFEIRLYNYRVKMKKASLEIQVLMISLVLLVRTLKSKSHP